MNKSELRKILFMPALSCICHQNYFTSVPVKTKNATEEFLKLAGSWEDSRSASEIIDDIYESRTSSTRFEALDGIFD